MVNKPRSSRTRGFNNQQDVLIAYCAVGREKSETPEEPTIPGLIKQLAKLLLLDVTSIKEIDF